MKKEKRIDAHQHFWMFDPIRDNWITDDMQMIRKDFMPEDLLPLLEQNNLDGCVVVQSDQSEKENKFQLKNAEDHPFIKGVVGWVDLQSKDIEDRLSYYQSFQKLKGFRHVLQGEKDRALMLSPEFKRGIGSLKNFNFTYDILIFLDQLKFAAELAATYPDQPFVLDHIAKPKIKTGDISDSERDVKSLASHENVFCKISGMVTEADWKNWKKEDFIPYMDVVVDAFGMDKLMFGSDWPVCQVAASYEQVVDLSKEYFSAFSKDEQDLFWGGNAIRFYGLAD